MRPRPSIVALFACLSLLTSSVATAGVTRDTGLSARAQAASDDKAVTIVTFSRNGAVLATGHRDGEVVIWDVAGKKESRKLAAHDDAAITGAAFSPDGATLARSGSDSEIWLWDTAAGAVRKILHGHEQPVRSIAYSPDGSMIASVGDDTRVIIWNGTTGQLERVLGGHTDGGTFVAFSPDSARLITAGRNGEIIVWDARSGQEVTRLRGHAGAVNAVTFSPDGKTIASGGEDTVIRIWNAATGRQLLALSGHTKAIRSLAFTAKKPLLVSGADDGQTIVWDLKTSKLKKKLKAKAKAITSVAFSPDGVTVARGSEDGTIVLTNVDTGSDVTTLVKPPKPEKSGKTSQDTSAPQQASDRSLDRSLAALDNGPGGPILVVRATANTFSDFYGEILRAEGLNAFTIADLSAVTGSLLDSYDVVILSEGSLTAAQVTMFTTWVESGGNLIAMRPDNQLASLLGVTSTGTTLAEGYLKVNTAQQPGSGIVGDPIQFHGTANRYTLNGATEVARLFSNATTETTNPAVVMRSVGTSNGHAAAFAYDLARSIVYTRQGNPSWAGTERDGFAPIRSDDMFYGAAAGNPQPDWVNLDNVAIPQADEQQRLLTNLILHLNLASAPLPRFWFLPNGHEAAVVLTGDDHGNGGTIGQFNEFIGESPAGCSIIDWECVRATSYIYTSTPMTNAQAAAFEAQGFEIALHLSTSCANYTPSSIETTLADQLSAWQQKYTSVAAPTTNRTHCIVFSDWDSQPLAELNHGIRLDTNYYYWPPSWITNRPGNFTGSAIPMRFARQTGQVIDIYQVATQMTDESGQTYPFTVTALLDAAVGPQKFYGVFTVNAHTDASHSNEAAAVVAAAQDRSVPVISARQLLTWLDGRNSSSFGSIAWTGQTLTFNVNAATGAHGLQAMLPYHSVNGALTSLTVGGSSVEFEVKGIKGIEYAVFSASSGNYSATYAGDIIPPTVTGTDPAHQASGINVAASVAATFSEAMNPATLTAGTVELRNPSNALVATTLTYSAVNRTVTLTPTGALTAGTTYTFRVKGGAGGVADVAGNVMTADTVSTFTTAAGPQCPCTLWPSSATPQVLSDNDPNAVNLGVKFRADSNGSITGIRFYKGPNNTGTHRVSLWTSSGQLLAQALSSGETASGWQQVNFSSPIAITANTIYVASYHTTSGNYSATLNYFANSGHDNGPLHALRDGLSGGNGVYRYGSTSLFPNQTWMAANYWVDVVYSIGTPPVEPDTTPPTVTATNPAANQTQIGSGATVTATFSEAMNAATITSGTFLLRVGANPPISASVSYDTASRTATLTPATALTAGTTYTATVDGGAGGVADLANNVLAQDFSWSFTTASPAVCPCSLWTSTDTPATITENDPAAIELGVKVRANTNGQITGIRFYKGPNNTGTHTVSLWTTGGQLLAQALSSGESASGWQQVTFTTPVAITANTIYVASYHTTSGNYSQNESYFTASRTNGPLTALQDGTSGGNGVYRYSGTPTFPDQTWNASNYWVDVVFTTASTPPDTTPPTVTTVLPTNGSTGVAAGTSVSAIFSEPLNASSVTPSAFELRAGSAPPVAASVTYDPATRTATLAPSATLNASTTYTATVRGGTNGVKDLAGNALASDFSWSFTTGTTTDPCASLPNPIAVENCQTGNPPSEWDISGNGDLSIQGFATSISVNKGQTVHFKINTDSQNYRIDIYRLGYYGGDGARRVATINPSVSLPQNQPNCVTNSSTGLIDCGNWAESASWAVPADAVSGVYIARPVRADTNGASHIVFVVRDDSGSSDLLFQTSDTTWQAYNDFGGNSLYHGNTSYPNGRAVKVSYNRPFFTRGNSTEDWLFDAEYPMIRWLERNGYNVSYVSGVDTDRIGSELLEHKVFMSVGHDEYWSAAQRNNVEAARNAGVHLAFFSGNEVYWKTRWEASIDGSATAYRTLVTYKEGTEGELICGSKCDPASVWTGLWRSGGAYDAGRPENALSGQISWYELSSSIDVPAADGKLRFWRNTSIANLQPNQTATLPDGVLGYEWNYEQPAYAESNPPGRFTFSSTTRDGRTHKLSIYRHSSGALVFGAGTVQWSWGLDNVHDRGSTAPDSRMQQATVNLLADMGVQPASLQSGLTAASASTDTTRPASTITAPTNGSTVAPGTTVTISGTATDTGGIVAAIEVSTDGGTTWQAATGRQSWTFSWTAPSSGTINIRSRAVDDSGNIEQPSAGVTVTIGTNPPPGSCPCSLWTSTDTPATITENDPAAVELGVKVRANTNGQITGIRFYKGPNNTGTHTVSLWTTGGQLLAQALSSGESASGWQQVTFTTPVAITANTIYVASYHTTSGNYSQNESYFTASRTNGPLTALQDGTSGGNGVYRYSGTPTFPDQTWNASNYWVDVVFTTSP